MCGIAGYLNFDPARAPETIQATIARMNRRLAHRGPDDRGQWADPDNLCHLGHTRLSVLDLSPAGHQPMHSADGRYTISFNGEIYNYRDLRRQLETLGHRFRTGTDTEVILAGFAVDGIDFFTVVDGMFALAIFDHETGITTLARDRAGEKPLYYAAGDRFFAFASELRALLEIDSLPVELSEAALALYFTLRYVPAPDTILTGVQMLEPGCVLQVARDGRQMQRRYYSFEIDQAQEVGPDRLDKYVDALEAELCTALTDRLNADVPLGAFLSSGVDSALCVALLTQKLGRPVKTFTIGFEGDERSEHEAARRIARHLGTEHREHVFTAADFDRICSEIGRLLDAPNGDRSCVPTYLLAEFTRRHVTVAISGDAGDELYGGYARYPGFAIAYDRDRTARAPAMVQAYIERGLPVLAAEAVRAALPQGYAAVLDFYARYAPAFLHLGRPALQALRQLDFRTYLPGAVLAKVDRMSMQHALEVRTPFLSPRMLALAGRAGAGLCWNGRMQKLALRHLLARYLPAEHVQAPKQGFGMPPSVFFNNRTRLQQELEAAQRRLQETRFFGQRPGALDRLLAAAGQGINAIWATIVLARWVDSVERPL
jgi:asparagine synthase (glutamine-hydrolysing)